MIGEGGVLGASAQGSRLSAEYKNVQGTQVTDFARPGV